MPPRTLVLALALYLLVAAPGGEAERQPVRTADREVVHGEHEPPLPFLGSGGVLLQVAALQPLPPLSLLRSRGAIQLPGARPRRGTGTGDAAAEVRQYLVAGIKACRLGTPPPLPRSGPATGQANSNAPA